MPQIIDDITSYFFRKKRDLYLIVFTGVKRDPISRLPEDEDPEKIPGRTELMSWLAENLPDTEVGPIFPFTSDSGFIVCPYDGSIYVDFSPEDHKKFADRWETQDGKSSDPRWQCYLFPLETYQAKYGGRIPNPNEFYDE